MSGLDVKREREAASRSRRYTNAALTAIAALLAWQALGGVGAGELPVPTATAQAGEPRDEPTGLVSAADQRKIMITQLSKMNNRLDRIERTLGKGVNVKIVDMPKPAKKDGE